jgi:filamentous hemagglutinin
MMMMIPKKPSTLTVANDNRTRSSMARSHLGRLFRQASVTFLSALLVFQPALVSAQQVTPDASAPVINQSGVGSAPNGVPLVDIVTPNSQGLSHNKYDQFNVGTPGLILNNHNGEVGTSLLGGVTPGNLNLKNSGPAAVILNEVTKQNRSSLDGPVEVFGGRADVIIANPNGITCNGCGFINTPRATLTTGTPDIDATGRLSGFTVNGGDVTFGEKGGNFADGRGSVDLFDVVSRTVKVNGPVYGKDLRLTAGRNKFNYATGEAKALETIAGTPEYAIDGSALGAMQAGRIKIVVTEKGAGVRMRANMAANAGELSLSSDGKISVGNISGNQGVTLRSKDKVTAKTVTSKKRIIVQADKGITLDAVAANEDVLATSGTGLLSVAGDVGSLANVRLTSAAGISAGSVTAANGGAMLTSASGDIAIAGKAAGRTGLTITANAGSITAASLVSFNNMALTSGLDIGVTGDMLAGGNIVASGRSIKSGTIASGLDIAATAADPNGKTILGASGNLNLIAASGAINSAALMSAGDMNVSAANLNAGGLTSHGNLTVNGTTRIRGQVLAGQKVDIKGQAISANSVISGVNFAATDASGTGAIILQSTGDTVLDASSGAIKVSTLLSAGNLAGQGASLEAQNVTAHGKIGITGNVNITGQLLAASDVVIEGKTISVATLISGVDFAATSAGGGAIKLAKNGSLTLKAGSGTIKTTTMLSAGDMNATAATIGAATVTAHKDINLSGNTNVSGQILSGNNVHISGKTVSAGLIASGVDFAASNALPSGAIVLGAAGDLIINATASGTVDAGTLLSAGLLDVTAGSVTAKNVTGHNAIHIAGNTNVGGQILGAGDVVIEGRTISVATLISGVDFAATSAGGGAIKLAKNGSLTLKAGSGSIKTTAMLSAGNLNATAATIGAATITAHKDINLSGNTNVSGQILSGNNVHISGKTVSAALIASGVDFAATAASPSGSIVVGRSATGGASTAGDLVINATSSGKVKTTALLSAGSIDISAGSFGAQTVSGHQDIRIAANTNVSSSILGGRHVSIKGAGIKAGAIVSGVDFAATENAASGNVVVGTVGSLALDAVSGSIEAGSLLSAGNLTGTAAQNITANAVSHQALNLTAGNEITLSGQSLSGSDLSLKAGSINVDTLVSGVDFAASAASADGSLILKPNTGTSGAITLAATQGSVTANTLTSGGNLSAHASQNVTYNSLQSFGSASLAANQGSISFDKATRAAGNITLTTKALDFSNNRGKNLATAKTVIVNAASATFAGSTYTWGGLGLNLSGNADFTGTTLNAVTNSGGSGNITVNAAGITINAASALLAQNDLTLTLSSLSNPGQLAAGHDLTFNIAGSLTNTPVGLIYAGNDAKLYVAGNLLNDQGAVMAGHDLTIAGGASTAANTNGAKNQSVTNISGLIRAENDVSILTENLTNKRLTTPTWTNVLVSDGVVTKFQMNPELFDKPYAHLFDRTFDTIDDHQLYPNIAPSLWDDYVGMLPGQATLADGTTYKAWTWTSQAGPTGADNILDWIRDHVTKDANGIPIIDPNNPSRIVVKQIVLHPAGDHSIIYSWDEASNLSQSVREDRFTGTLAPEALIRAGRNLNVDATTLNNSYSSIEAGGNATLKGSVLNNEGVTLSRATTTTCNAQGACEAYDANGNRDPSKDIANGTSVLSSVESIGGASGNIRAAGNLDISGFATVNNTSAPGSMAGSATLASSNAPGDPTAALSGLTAGAALFTPNAALAGLQAGSNPSTATGPLAAGGSALLPASTIASGANSFADLLRVNGAALAALSKPNSGGFGGTVPGQIFLYETRATFLDVGRFYGSGYFINRIGYKPEHEIPFLGDAWFENQLIDTQLRQLVGQGLGKGSFIPGSDAIEQMKLLLDNGIAYAKAHNLKIGEKLSPEQAAALTQSIVLYEKKIVQGIEVLAPVVYLASADKANLTVAGALISGGSLNMDVGNVNNSGSIAAKTDLKLAATNIKANGGSFVAGGNLQLQSAGDLTLSAQTLNIGGTTVINPNGGVVAGGNANLIANDNLTIQGAQVKADGDAGLSAKNVTFDVVKVDNNGQQNATGARVSAGGNLAITAKDNVNVIGSSAKAGKALDVTAQDGSVNIVTTDLARKTDDGYVKITSTEQQQSQLSSGTGTSIKAGDDILVSGSSINAKGSVALDAGDDVNITVAQEQAAVKFGKDKLTETTHQGSQIKSDGRVSVTAGGATAAGVPVTAGTDAGHDLNIIGSSIEADGKVNLKAAGDITIAEARDTATLDYQDKKKKSGLFGSSKTMNGTLETETAMGSSIKGGDGVNISSAGDTLISASEITAGRDKTATGVPVLAGDTADININTGGNLVIAAGKNLETENSKTKSKGFLKKGSTDNSLYDETTIGSEIGASGNINLNAGDAAVIAGSSVTAGQSITLQGDSVSVIGAQENHASESNSKKSGLGAGSGDGFFSIWGKEGKEGKQSATLNAPSLLSAGKDVIVTARETDINVLGSQIAAGQDIDLYANRDVNILPGAESSSSFEQEKKSGFGLSFSSGGGSASIGIGFGSSKDKSVEGSETNAVSSLSAGRDLIITAGRDANLQAAQVSAERDVDIWAADNVNLLSAQDKSNYEEVHEKLFAGVTFTVSSGLISAAENINGAAERFSNTSGKSGAKAVSNVAIASLNAYQALKNIADISGLTNLPADKKPSVAELSLTLGFQQSKRTAKGDISTPVPTIIRGGNSVTIEASSGNLTGHGAQIVAGYDENGNPNGKDGDIALIAGKDVILESAQELANNSTKNSSSGVQVGFDLATGLPVGSFNFATGKSNGSTLTQVNSHVNGTGNVFVQSGRDTALKGATISGSGVVMDVGRNLTIESQLDLASQKANQFSIGGGFGPGGFGVSGALQKASGDAALVGEQSGIHAGSGGFDITVGGKTSLIGGLITSEANPALNKLETGTLEVSDLDTHSNWKATTYGGGIANGIPTMAPPLKEGESETGKALAAISPGQIIITDPANQAQNLDDLRRDTTNTNTSLPGIPDLQQVLSEQYKTQADYQAAAATLATAIGDMSDKFRDDAKARGDKDGEAFWAAGGIGRAALHAAGGALLGGVNDVAGAIKGALGGAVATLTAPQIEKLVESVIAGTKLAGTEEGEFLVNSITVSLVQGLAAAAGGGDAAAYAGHEVVYNYLTHQQLSDYEKKLKECKDDACRELVEQEKIALWTKRQDEAVDACQADAQACHERLSLTQTDLDELLQYYDEHKAENSPINSDIRALLSLEFTMLETLAAKGPLDEVNQQRLNTYKLNSFAQGVQGILVALSNLHGGGKPGGKALSSSDFPEVSSKISQKQLRHIAGKPEFDARPGGGYLNSVDDAQKVLDAYRSGQATILGKNPQGFPIVRFDGVTGTNVNSGSGFPAQPTNVFIIKGTKSPSVVPTNPNWKVK